jgi:hypothetical protein
MDLTMMERVGDRWEKNGRILFDRPKPTLGCSVSGRRRRTITKCVVTLRRVRATIVVVVKQYYIL